MRTGSATSRFWMSYRKYLIPVIIELLVILFSGSYYRIVLEGLDTVTPGSEYFVVAYTRFNGESIFPLKTANLSFYSLDHIGKKTVGAGNLFACADAMPISVQWKGRDTLVISYVGTLEESKTCHYLKYIEGAGVTVVYKELGAEKEDKFLRPRQLFIDDDWSWFWEGLFKVKERLPQGPCNDCYAPL